MSGLAGKLAAAAAAVAVLVVALIVASAVHLLPQLRNPFAQTTTDRSGPALLKSITALSRYEAASGSFQVVVDLSKQTAFIPRSSRAATRCSSGRAPRSPTWTSAG
jgi:hypothetical protein